MEGVISGCSGIKKIRNMNKTNKNETMKVKSVKFSDPEELKRKQKIAKMSLKVLAFIYPDTKSVIKLALKKCKLPKPDTEARKNVFLSEVKLTMVDGSEHLGYVIQANPMGSHVLKPIIIDLQKEGKAFDLTSFWSH